MVSNLYKAPETIIKPSEPLVIVSATNPIVPKDVASTLAGALTTTKPVAPEQLVILGWVERVDNIVGSIYVKIDNGYELNELHDVNITTPTGGQVLTYNSTGGYWKNTSLTAGSGMTITPASNGSITFDATATAAAGGAIWVNTQTISQNYTIASGYNGLSVGPITIDTGYAVTVSTGSIWQVL